MYGRLAALLHIKKVLTNKLARRVLYLHRDLLFLQNFTMRFSGHHMHVKCYEAAMGELVFKAYIPKYSAVIETVVNEELRLRLFDNLDGQLENHIAECMDGKILLPFMMD